jgi:hypothetical protein
MIPKRIRSVRHLTDPETGPADPEESGFRCEALSGASAQRGCCAGTMERIDGPTGSGVARLARWLAGGRGHRGIVLVLFLGIFRVLGEGSRGEIGFVQVPAEPLDGFFVEHLARPDAWVLGL